jgi:DNA-binding transcriptional LysR family regulator
MNSARSPSLRPTILSDKQHRDSRYAIPVDTQILRTLLVLARTGSFTATAAELHVVQSTVASRIKTLERELDIRLFDRLPNRTHSTDAGQRVAAHARELLDAQQRLVDSARADGIIEGEVALPILAASKRPAAASWPDSR